MKKFVGTICSAVASVLTFIFLAVPAWGMKGFAVSKNWNGYSLISGKQNDVKVFEEVGAWKAYRVFAIILLVLAVVLAAYAVFMLLVNLNVVKVGNTAVLELVNKVLLSVTVVVALCCVIACLGIVGDLAKSMNLKVKTLKDMYDSIGTKAGLWLVFGFNALACAVAWVLPAVCKDKN